MVFWSLCILFPPTDVHYCVCVCLRASVCVCVSVCMCVCVCIHLRCFNISCGGTVTLPSNLRPKNTFPAFVKPSMLLYKDCKRILFVIWMRPPPSQKLHILPHKHTCMRTRTQNTYLQLYPTHTSLLYVFHVVCVGMRIYLSVSACLCASHCLRVCVW